jgi:hypothetical protein
LTNEKFKKTVKKQNSNISFIYYKQSSTVNIEKLLFIQLLPTIEKLLIINTDKIKLRKINSLNANDYLDLFNVNMEEKHAACAFSTGTFNYYIFH